MSDKKENKIKSKAVSQPDEKQEEQFYVSLNFLLLLWSLSLAFHME